MKKILAGMLFALLTVNVYAVQISYEVYQSDFFDVTGGKWEWLEGNSEPFITSANLSLSGFSNEYSNVFEDVDEEGQLLGHGRHNTKYFYADPVFFDYAYDSDMAELQSSYQANETNIVMQDSGVLRTFYWEMFFTELGKTPPNYGEDNHHAEISIGGSKYQHWTKNEAGLVTGQYMISQYSIDLRNESTELAYGDYDDLDEIYLAFEQASADGSELILSHNVSVFSFELSDPDGQFACIYCDNTIITEEESRRYEGKARIASLEYADVPEPATGALLALSLIGLVRLKKKG